MWVESFFQQDAGQAKDHPCCQTCQAELKGIGPVGLLGERRRIDNAELCSLRTLGNFQLVRLQLALKLSDSGAHWVISMAPGLGRSRLRVCRCCYGLLL